MAGEIAACEARLSSVDLRLGVKLPAAGPFSRECAPISRVCFTGGRHRIDREERAFVSAAKLAGVSRSESSRITDALVSTILLRIVEGTADVPGVRVGGCCAPS